MKKLSKINSHILDTAYAKIKKEQEQKVKKLMRKFHPITNCRIGGYQSIVEPSVVFEAELSELKEGTDGFAWTCCPFHDDHNPSFCVNLESGWYKCHSTSCEETGSNIVGFVSALHGFNFAEAREYLETQYG